MTEVLDRLVEHDIVTKIEGGPEAVYQIGPNQHLSAAYYRNVVIHFFVNSAIAELALERVATNQPSDPIAMLFDEAFAMRDLLKFEFFFASKDEFAMKSARKSPSATRTGKPKSQLARPPRFSRQSNPPPLLGRWHRSWNHTR